MQSEHTTIAHVPTIIAGGRDYRLTRQDHERLDNLPISQVISGDARGVDKDGADWARSRDIPVVTMPADWDKYGKAAGPIRNTEMAKVAKAAVIFPGGRGTKNMRQEAHARGLDVYDFHDPEYIHLEPGRNTRHDGVLFKDGTPVLMPHAQHWQDMFCETRLYTYDAQMRPTHPIEDVTSHRGHGVNVGRIGAYMTGSGQTLLPGRFSLAVRPTDRLLDLIQAYTISLQDQTHWRVTETSDSCLNVSFSYGCILGFKFVTLFDVGTSSRAAAYINKCLSHG